MAVSKIDICNISLAHLGADAIRSFDEDNKRARQCDIMYGTVISYLQAKFDWPFARKFKSLRLLDTSAEEIPTGLYAFKLPSDCRIPRDMYPPGSKDYWEVMGNRLYCKRSSEVYLYYTARDVSEDLFSDSFVTLAALGLAVRIGPSITQDKKLIRELYQQYVVEQNECWATDANVGNIYREHDETPENDTFVSPDYTDAVTPSSRA